MGQRADLDMDLYPLLDFLSHLPPAEAFTWQGWRIQRILGGRNSNLLFRATRSDADLAVKFSRHDARNRAGREFNTLSVLHHLGLPLAPKPVIIEKTRYPHPVVVQTWVEGEVSDRAPASREEWLALLDHLAAVHAIVPEYASRPVQHAVMDFHSARDAVNFVLQELEHFPSGSRPPDLISLAERLKRTDFPTWPFPEVTLGRGDPYIANFIRRPEAWASVDWENSGWCDPAFEIGELMAHPCYTATSPETWEWFLDAAAERHPGDDTFCLRVRTYRAIMLVRLAGQFARYEWERTTGALAQGRPAEWPESWRAPMPQEYLHAVATAQQVLDAL